MVKRKNQIKTQDAKSRRRRAEKTGRRAELYAEIYLRFKGYHILERRFKTRHGEIDLIARRADILVFVEVKKRQTRVLAFDSLTTRNKARIFQASRLYIAHNRFAQKLAHRYDAVFISGRFWGQLSHEPDFWRPH